MLYPTCGGKFQHARGEQFRSGERRVESQQISSMISASTPYRLAWRNTSNRRVIEGRRTSAAASTIFLMLYACPVVKCPNASLPTSGPLPTKKRFPNHLASDYPKLRPKGPAGRATLGRVFARHRSQKPRNSRDEVTPIRHNEQRGGRQGLGEAR